MSQQPIEPPVDVVNLPPDLFADVPPEVPRGYSGEPSDAGCAVGPA